MLLIQIQRDAKEPAVKQIYEQIRQKIIRGELEAGYKLPPTRDLSQELRVSRNVMIEAYEQLVYEGYLVSRQGSGTFVAEGAAFGVSKRAPFKDNEDNPVESKTERDLIDFRTGVPALDLFPVRKWMNLYSEVCTAEPNTILGYGDSEGCIELRKAIARYLSRTRGVVCDYHQVIVTTGAMQGINIIARMLLNDSRNTVLMENPAHYDIRNIFSAAGANLVHIEVDDEGITTELLPENVEPSLIYVTPSHQYPTGGVLTIQRRIKLLKYAREKGGYIVEDDYDSEYRYEGTPISSLQGLDPEKVIYVGSFSKILAPSLRIGYVILPEALLARFKFLKLIADKHSPFLEQYTLAKFIERGFLERHISKMKKVYQRRQRILRDCIQHEFSDEVKVSGTSTGLHLVLEFANYKFSEEVLTLLENKGVKVYPEGIYCIHKKPGDKKIILGYGNIGEEKIREGIKRMRAVLNHVKKHEESR